MGFKIISFLFLVFLNSAFADPSAIVDCFFVGNTDSMEFICEDFNGTYPKDNCFRRIFGNSTNKAQLKVFNIGSCRGSSLNDELFIQFSNLKEFNIPFYGTAELKLNQFKMKYLEKLNATHNNISSISTECFDNSPDIVDIDFSFNLFNSISGNYFRSATKLQKINFSNNKIFSVDSDSFQVLPELVVLDLSNNLIKSINVESLRNNTRLKVLRLDDNPLKSIDCSIFSLSEVYAFSSVLNLNCSTEIQIDLNSETYILVRDVKKSSELRYSKENFKSVQFLNISGNNLKNTQDVIKLLGFSLQILDVSSNYIGKLNGTTFKNLNNLQTLNLSLTNLSNFYFNTFYHLNKLKSLDLSYNRLKKVNFMPFLRNFKNLHTLKLEANELTEIDSVDTVNFPQLTYLGISKNLFSCHYLSRFLRRWEDLQLFHNPSDQSHIDGVDCYDEDFKSENEDEAKVTTTESNEIIKNESTSPRMTDADGKLEETTEYSEAPSIKIMESTSIEIVGITSSETISSFDMSYTDETTEDTTEIVKTIDRISTEPFNESSVTNTIMITADETTEQKQEKSKPANTPNKMLTENSSSSEATNSILAEIRFLLYVLLALLMLYLIAKMKLVQRIKRKMTHLLPDSSVVYKRDVGGSQHYIEMCGHEAAKSVENLH